MFLKLDVYCTWSYIIIFLELKKVDKNVMVCFKPEYIEDIIWIWILRYES